ncbi:MAG: HAMP domain-containing histidine kinase [Chloroflexi bacterium]|nr:HAMP domain-containing histidine kinase [Chloroflexota bacterium]
MCPVAHALRVGVAVSLSVLALVVLLRAVPALALSYPLALVLLLAVGPLAAVPALTVREAAKLGLVGGAVSAVAATLVFAGAVHLLGEVRWSFVAPASSPPVPALPRPQLVPFLSWPLHYLLVLQPLLGLALAAGYTALFGPQAKLAAALERLAAALPAPVRTKMLTLLLLHAALTAGVGWISFAVIEDMHLRGHVFQWQLHWGEHVGDLTRALDEQEAALARSARDGSSVGAARETAGLVAARERVAGVIAHLHAAPQHQGIWVSRPAMTETAQRYEPLLGRVLAAQSALAATGDPETETVDLLFARAALSALAEAVRRDTRAAVDATDLAHHNSLFALMALVVLTVASGLLLGRVAAQAITRPVGLVAGHLTQLASGDFSGRIWAANRDELGALVTKANEVTAELDRLYRQEQAAREAAEALAARERALAEAKEFLTQTIVHDLKQPIGVVVGFAELLELGRFGALQPRQADVVRQLAAAAQRLEVLAGDVVDTFRLEHGVLPLERAAVQPADLVRSARDAAVSPTARPPEIAIEPDLPPVLVDRGLMLRALANLIANAYQHAGPTARVRLRAGRLLGGAVVFQVEDDGPGVPPEERERIFERFVQGRCARAGSGLGLAFARLVVERHGGRIWVGESPDGGAQFSLAVPAAVAAAQPVAARP